MKITGLEALRGLCAIIVAIYHCLAWSGHMLPGWGLYPVYIFFVISGAVLYVNYHDMTDVRGFLWKRLTRLAPLYAAAVAASAILNHQWPHLGHFLNLSLLFGFVNPGSTSTVVGGWSLGIEMVFYILMPALLPLLKDLRIACATFVVLLLLRIVYVEHVLSGVTLEQAWVAYTQPGTFLCFFFGGMLLGRLRPSSSWWPLGLLLLLLIVAPGHTHEETLTGWRGAVSTLLSIAVVTGFFWAAGGIVSRLLGDASYGLYLLHPIVFAIVQRWLPASLPVKITATIAISFGCALLAAHFYEKPVRRWAAAMGQA